MKKKKHFKWRFWEIKKIKVKALEKEYQEKLRKEREKHDREVTVLTHRIEAIDNMLFKKLCEITALQEKIEAQDEKINQQLKEKASLNREIAKLKKQLAESMTDKYLVRKVPSGRRPKADSMKCPKRQAPQVQKFLKEVEKINE